jgi:hypothetical protein
MLLGRQELKKWEKGLAGESNPKPKPVSYGVKINKARFKGLAGLIPSETKVFIALQLYADENGYCYPSIRSLAELCGLDKNTIYEAVNRLKNKGWILQITKTKGRGGVRHTYHLKEW